MALRTQNRCGKLTAPIDELGPKFFMLPHYTAFTTSHVETIKGHTCIPFPERYFGQTHRGGEGGVPEPGGGLRLLRYRIWRDEGIGAALSSVLGELADSVRVVNLRFKNPLPPVTFGFSAASLATVPEGSKAPEGFDLQSGPRSDTMVRLGR